MSALRPVPDPEGLLARLVAEVGEAHVADARRRHTVTDAEARLAALAAEVAVPVPARVPTPVPLPRPRILPLTPVPVVRRSTPPVARRADTPVPIDVGPDEPPTPTPTPPSPLPPPLPPRTPRPVVVSEPPVPLPDVDAFEAEASVASGPASELAVDDFDILEAEESVGPGTASGKALAGPLDLSVGDLDGVGESTVDRDLRAFFADDSVEMPSPVEAARARPDPADSIDSSGSERRLRRDKSLLTNVKKLFKK